MSEVNKTAREFGLRLKQCREAAHMTQQELADKLGYTKSFISKVEHGIHEIPQSKILAAAEILNTTHVHLMGWDNDINQRTGLTAEECQLISYYRSLNHGGRTALMATAQSLTTNPVFTNDTHSKAV